MVRAVGVEPTLCHQNWILSPARLPVPPRPRGECRRPDALHRRGSFDRASAFSDLPRHMQARQMAQARKNRRAGSDGLSRTPVQLRRQSVAASFRRFKKWVQL